MDGPHTVSTIVNEDVLRAFEGADAVGEDPRLTEEFEVIEAELAKIGGVEQEEVDWARVEALAYKLLTTAGKDLRCVCYWVFARLKSGGLEGLEEGLATFVALLKTFGSELHPRRKRARIAATHWLNSHLDQEFKVTSLTATNADQARLSAYVDEALAEFATLELDTTELYSIRETLSGLRIVASQAEREEEIRSAFPPGHADIGIALLEHVEAPISETPLTLRIRRWALWMNPAEPVGAERREVSIDTAPAADLAGMFGSQQWDSLLTRSEQLFTSSPYWLDLSVWTARAALPTLGEEAARVVTGELRALLSRDPTIVNATDRDGHPLVSDEAREWLEREVLKSHEGSSNEESASVELPGDIRQLLDEGRVREAMLASQKWLNVPSGRVRFARCVAVGNAFIAIGAAQQSFLVFRGLHAQMRALTVKEWEPQLFTACLQGYLNSKKAAQGLDMEDEPLLEELSVLDPTALLQVLPE